MPAFLRNGLFISEIVADNVGVFGIDTDGDGNVTKADEFVEIQNGGVVAADLTGIQLWSATNGLLYSFTGGDVQAGDVATVIGEYTGALPAGFYEASTNNNLNFLPDGEGNKRDTIFLVDTVNNEYISLAYGDPPIFALPTGFPSGYTSLGGETVPTDVPNGTSILRDMAGAMTTTTAPTPATAHADGVVHGTSSGETIGAGYSDAGGDTIDANDAMLTGEVGDDDIVAAGGGNDTVFGNAAHDEIYGGAGSDTLVGNEGNDSLFGGSGDDVIATGNNGGAFAGTDDGTTSLNYASGGIGNDTIYGSDGVDATDSLEGDAGNDLIFGNGATDFIYGGTGSDTLIGNSGMDTIYGGSGDDILAAGNNDGAFTGSDDSSSDLNVLDGGAGFDTIYGGDGWDTIYGGEGEDSLYGGDGDDTISGGDGNDVVYAGDGSDIITTGDDKDIIYAGAGDTVDGGEGGSDMDTLDVTAGGIARIVYSQSNPENGVVEFMDGNGGVTGTLTFSNIENINYVPCFTAGTLIDTANGPRPVEKLKVGDLVETRDHGLRPVRWVGVRHLSAEDLRHNPNLAPITIKAGTLDGALPEQDLIVSPQHRILMSSALCELYFADAEILTPAVSLLHREGVERNVTDGVTYVHIMFDQHELVRTYGSWSEGFQPGAAVLSEMDEKQRAELFQLFPELRKNPNAIPAARPTMKGYEAKLVA